VFFRNPRFAHRQLEKWSDVRRRSFVRGSSVEKRLSIYRISFLHAGDQPLKTWKKCIEWKQNKI
jgi:hypothetical protein